jgi:hypothetical protein
LCRYNPGMPDAVVNLEGLDSESVIRLPVNASNSRIQVTLRHAGYQIHGVIMYKWCTRTCLTHAWWGCTS